MYNIVSAPLLEQYFKFEISAALARTEAVIPIRTYFIVIFRNIVFIFNLIVKNILSHRSPIYA